MTALFLNSKIKNFIFESSFTFSSPSGFGCYLWFLDNLSRLLQRWFAGLTASCSYGSRKSNCPVVVSLPNSVRCSRCASSASLPLATLPLASLPLASLPLASLPLASLPPALLPPALQTGLRWHESAGRSTESTESWGG